jgi:hypothetical protein
MDVSFDERVERNNLNSIAGNLFSSTEFLAFPTAVIY